MSDIPKHISYLVAKPRMKKYIEYAADIYDIYLDYISPEDIHVYSIDEAFLDVTKYLPLYQKEAREYAKFLMNQIATRAHIPAAVGIGTNLYLAKVALDITAKKNKDHIGVLNEETYRETLGHHRPITDFWQISSGTANRLARFGVYDMAGVAALPESTLYRTFGINAELLIDHAYGRECCEISDIKAYTPKSKSISSSQILFEDYTAEKALLVLTEMALAGCEEMMRRKVICNRISIGIAYSKEVIPASHGGAKLLRATSLFSVIKPELEKLFHKITVRNTPIRRLAISFDNLASDDTEGYDLFTDFEKVEQERLLERTVLSIKDRYGKSAVFRGMDLQDGATALARNKMIGGHNGE